MWHFRYSMLICSGTWLITMHILFNKGFRYIGNEVMTMHLNLYYPEGNMKYLYIKQFGVSVTNNTNIPTTVGWLSYINNFAIHPNHSFNLILQPGQSYIHNVPDPFLKLYIIKRKGFKEKYCYLLIFNPDPNKSYTVTEIAKGYCITTFN